jgi:hypothetical protein
MTGGYNDLKNRQNSRDPSFVGMTGVWIINSNY